jgi:hypothetical protein
VAKYLERSCPNCNGYLGIVVPERKQAINGRGLECGYRLVWVVVLGKRLTRRSALTAVHSPLLDGERHRHHQSGEPLTFQLIFSLLTMYKAWQHVWAGISPTSRIRC